MTLLNHKVVFIAKGLNTHTCRVLNFFSENHVLHRFYTTLVFSRTRFSHFLTSYFPKVSNQILSSEIFDKTERFVYFELIRRFFHFLRWAKIEDYIWEIGDYFFDIWVAIKIDKETTIVFGYEHASYFTFKRAKKLSKLCILEQNSVFCDYFTNVILPLVSSTCSETERMYLNRKYLNKKNSRRNKRRKAELDMADVIICNSEFVNNSLIYGGIDPNKIIINQLYREISIKNNTPRKKDKLVFCTSGNLSLLKGTHLILETWLRNFISRTDLELILVGNLELENVNDIPKDGNIKLRERLSHSEYIGLLKTTDVFILNTFTDSFGVSVAEALQNGVLVITTKNCGAADLIVNGDNGFVISPGSNIELLQAIFRCIEIKKCRDDSEGQIGDDLNQLLIQDVRIDNSFELGLLKMMENFN